MTEKKFEIEQCWDGYLTKVLPPDCSQIQREETKLAFYAGFVSCFEIVNNLTELSEDDACEALDKIRKESFGVMDKLIEKMEG